MTYRAAIYSGHAQSTHCIVCDVLLRVAGTAQNLIPVIQLSAKETATAKQLVQALRDSEERSTKAKAAWEQFHQLYQTAHPDLPNVRFTEDFKLAVARMSSSSSEVPQLAAIELSAEERRKLETLHREMDQSAESHKQAVASWRDFRIQLIVNHIRSSYTVGGRSVWLSNDAVGAISLPSPWTEDLAFAPDFKLAAPRSLLPAQTLK